MQQDEIRYSIPARFRRMENMHIVFWLVKDISWCLIWKVLGLAMFVPTLSISVIIAYRTRHIVSELAHNLAITLWICANGFWMISEFFHFDEMPVWGQFEGKHIALIPFIAGSLVLTYYYIFLRPKELKERHTVTF